MDREVFIVAELQQGRITQETLELISFARGYAGGRLPAVLMTGRNIGEQAEELSEKTGCAIYQIQGDHLEVYTLEAYCAAIAEVVSERPPALVILPHSSMGSDLAPRLAVKMEATCITAVETLQGRAFIRSVCSGRYAAEIVPIAQSVVITVLPGASPPHIPESCPPGPITKVQAAQRPVRTRVLGVKEPLHRDSAVKEAEVIVSAGRGVGKKENLSLIRDLAAFFPHSAVGASRPLCDMGWLEYGRQIGSTGQTVTPKLYIACGISGAIQHVAGMKGSQLVVAINTDPEAAIFRISHVCIVEDLTTFLPVLLEELKKG